MSNKKWRQPTSESATPAKPEQPPADVPVPAWSAETLARVQAAAAAEAAKQAAETAKRAQEPAGDSPTTGTVPNGGDSPRAASPGDDPAPGVLLSEESAARRPRMASVIYGPVMQEASTEDVDQLRRDCMRVAWQIAMLGSGVLDTIPVGELRAICAPDIPLPPGMVRKDGTASNHETPPGHPSLHGRPADAPVKETGRDHRTEPRGRVHPLLLLMKLVGQALAAFHRLDKQQPMEATESEYEEMLRMLRSAKAARERLGLKF